MIDFVYWIKLRHNEKSLFVFEIIKTYFSRKETYAALSKMRIFVPGAIIHRIGKKIRQSHIGCSTFNIPIAATFYFVMVNVDAHTNFVFRQGPCERIMWEMLWSVCWRFKRITTKFRSVCNDEVWRHCTIKNTAAYAISATHITKSTLSPMAGDVSI